MLTEVAFKELDEDLFANNLLLQHVLIRNTELTQLPQNLFLHNKKLTSLNISSKYKGFYPPAFTGLEYLTTLSLSAYVQGGIIKATDLAALKSLKEINVLHFDIDLASALAVWDAPELTTAEFSACNLGALPSRAFERAPNLVKLGFRHSTVQSYGDGAFDGLPKLSILHLDLENTIYVGSKLFSNSMDLTELDIRGKHSARLIQPIWFGGLKKLETLMLEDMPGALMASDYLLSSPALSVLVISGKQIKTISPRFLNSIPRLRYLEIRDTAISQFPEFQVPMFDLTELNLIGNQILQIDHTLQNLPALKDLNIENEAVKSISAGVFSDLASLQYITIKNCIDLEDIGANLFGKSSTLIGMYFTSNAISNLAEDAFKGLHALRKLDLYGNKIKIFEPGTLNGLTKLEFINLDDNLISEVSAEAFVGPSLSTGMEVWLQGNPLSEDTIDKLSYALGSRLYHYP